MTYKFTNIIYYENVLSVKNDACFDHYFLKKRNFFLFFVNSFRHCNHCTLQAYRMHICNTFWKLMDGYFIFLLFFYFVECELFFCLCFICFAFCFCYISYKIIISNKRTCIVIILLWF